MGSRSPSTADPNEAPARGKRAAPRELTCKLTMGRGKARTVRTGPVVLTDDALRFRTARTGKDGKDFGVHVRFEDVISAIVEPSGVDLTVTPREGEPFSLHLGRHAAAWKTIISERPSRLDELGIRAGMRVAIVGLADAELAEEIETCVPTAASLADQAGDLDVLVAGAEHRADLARLGELGRRLKRGGVLFVVHPQGARGLTTPDVIAAARAAGGLVDSGSVVVSRTHVALRLVTR